MSILNSYFRDVWELFFPSHCAVCGERLEEGEQSICTLCRMEAPLTRYWLEADNPVLERCRDFMPTQRASAFLFFIHQSGWRELIHQFKYRGQWKLAFKMGRWYGRCLRESGLYDDIDLVVPLPLHPLKRWTRGYNQAEYLAEGIARELGVKVDRRSVFRQRNTQSQARKHRQEREKNVENAFRVRHPEKLRGLHLLLVDDVMTTGSTLVSCGKSILEASSDVKLSVAVLAVSSHELGRKD